MKTCKHLIIPTVWVSTVTNSDPPKHCAIDYGDCFPKCCPHYEPIDEEQERRMLE